MKKLYKQHAMFYFFSKYLYNMQRMIPICQTLYVCVPKCIFFYKHLQE